MTIYDDDDFDSPEEALAHLRKLLAASRARKHALEVQLASYGLAAPSHITIDLDQAQAEVRRLHALIKKLQVKYYFHVAIEQQIMAFLVNPADPSAYVKAIAIGEGISSDGQLVVDILEKLEESGQVRLIRSAGYGLHTVMAVLTARGRLTAAEIANTEATTKHRRLTIAETQIAVLETIATIEQHSPSKWVNDVEIAVALGVDLQETRDHMDVLAADDFAKTMTNILNNHSAVTTGRGRLRLREI